MDCCSSWFKAKEFPPEDEVKKGRYIYKPVPVDDVELANIPLPHLLKPGPHTDKFWITMFPKKIRDQLVRQPGHSGQRVIGWGIRVNESLNWTSFYCWYSSHSLQSMSLSLSTRWSRRMTLPHSAWRGGQRRRGTLLNILFSVWLAIALIADKEAMVGNDSRLMII